MSDTGERLRGQVVGKRKKQAVQRAAPRARPQRVNETSDTPIGATAKSSARKRKEQYSEQRSGQDLNE
jgi:hypothetical protein